MQTSKLVYFYMISYPSQLKNDSLHEYFQPPSKPERETTAILALIKQNKESALTQCQPIEPQEVAARCFDTAESHPLAITTLLQWNDAVAAAAIDLLCTHGCEVGVMAVTHCLLQAGHALHTMDKPWPTSVKGLLEQRKNEHDLYWLSKSEKRIKNPSLDPLKNLFDKEFPFYSLNPEKYTNDVGRQWSENNGEQLRRRFDKISGGKAKAFLNQFTKFDIKGAMLFMDDLTQMQVENRMPNNLPVHPKRVVHFTPDQFGALLVQVAHRLKVGEERCVHIGFFVSRKDFNGHTMRVFIKKDLHPMGLKVAVHDMNVTGDMKHFRIQPENLGKQSFLPFDTRNELEERGADVLAMQLHEGDEELARALAGRCVRGDANVQISSLLQALACGVAHEVEAAASALQHEDLSGLGHRLKEVQGAMFMALENDHADALLALARSSLPRQFDRSVIEALLSASFRGTPPMEQEERRELLIKMIDVLVGQIGQIGQIGQQDKAIVEDGTMSRRHGEPGLRAAMEKGHHKAVRALAELLNTVKDQLQPEDAAFILAFLQAEHKGDPCLLIALEDGHAEAIRAFGELLKPVLQKLPPQSIEFLLNPRDRQGASGLYLAMSKGHADAITAFVQLLATAHSRLAPAAMERILQTGSFGEPPLYRALLNNQGDCILAFGRALRTLPLLPDMWVNLLSTNTLATSFGRKLFGSMDEPGGLEAAIKNGKVGAIRAFSQVVIELQSSSSRLDKHHAKELLKEMHNAQGKRSFFFLVNTAEYKQHVKKKPELYAVFKLAKRELGA